MTLNRLTNITDSLASGLGTAIWQKAVDTCSDAGMSALNVADLDRTTQQVLGRSGSMTSLWLTDDIQQEFVCVDPMA